MVVIRAGVSSTIEYTLGPHIEGKLAAAAIESVAGIKVCVYEIPLNGAIEKLARAVGSVRRVLRHGLITVTVKVFVAAVILG